MYCVKSAVRVETKMSDEAKAARNLSLIQRIDPFVTEVVGYASHVVIYAFKEEADQQGVSLP